MSIPGPGVEAARERVVGSPAGLAGAVARSGSRSTSSARRRPGARAASRPAGATRSRRRPPGAARSRRPSASAERRDDEVDHRRAVHREELVVLVVETTCIPGSASSERIRSAAGRRRGRRRATPHQSAPRSACGRWSRSSRPSLGAAAAPCPSAAGRSWRSRAAAARRGSCRYSSAVTARTVKFISAWRSPQYSAQRPGQTPGWAKIRSNVVVRRGEGVALEARLRDVERVDDVAGGEDEPDHSRRPARSASASRWSSRRGRCSSRGSGSASPT